MDVILSTRNKGKAEEIRAMFADTPINIISLEEAGIEGSVKEGVVSLEENADKKNWFGWRNSNGKWVVAEDTGLFIPALNDAPGVITADWGGEHVKGQALRDFAIEQFKTIPESERLGRWRTVAVVRDPKGNCAMFEGASTGRLLIEPQGPLQPDMPFSQIFVPEGTDKTWGQLREISIDLENSLSHRGRAFAQVKDYLLGQL
jgi:XTP/dITP diphosphohydrolase